MVETVKGGGVGSSSRRSARHRAGQGQPVLRVADRPRFGWVPSAGDEGARPLFITARIVGVGLVISMLASVSGLLDATASQAADDLGQLLAGALAAGCCWWSWRRATAPDRLWRLLLALGTGGWACGQAIWTYYQVFQNLELPSPSLADVGYFCLPVFALPALWVFPARAAIRTSSTAARARLIGGRPFFRIVFILDSLVVVGSLFLLTWSTALGAAVATRGVSRPAFLVALGYPVTDLLLVVFVVLLGRFRQPRNPGALMLLGLGMWPSASRCPTASSSTWSASAPAACRRSSTSASRSARCCWRWVRWSPSRACRGPTRTTAAGRSAVWCCCPTCR